MPGQIPWQEVVLYLGVFLFWYSGITVWYNLSLNWLIYPWTLLSWDGPPAILETVVGLLLAVEIPLVPLIAGYMMIRKGDKWKKRGVILVSVSFAFMVGWAAYVIYASVARVTIGSL